SFNQIYAEWIGNYRPARAVAGVAELHFGAALEIEATAVYA
ncbi:RidA family protein, partial [Salmonella enterica]|nr:RidA family protein [Salmonella enterica]